LGPKGGEGYKKRVSEDQYGGNIMYSCIQMEKLDLLKLSSNRESGGNKGE
jgi:hypothetical protein